jgi:hypothetical protein
MARAWLPVRQLTQGVRACGATLLADADDPHAELLTLVWGPRFDREHALGLWVRLSQRQPQAALPVLPQLLSAADRFDALATPAQQRLRRLILRHRQAVLM